MFHLLKIIYKIIKDDFYKFKKDLNSHFVSLSITIEKLMLKVMLIRQNREKYKKMFQFRVMKIFQGFQTKMLAFAFFRELFIFIVFYFYCLLVIFQNFLLLQSVVTFMIFVKFYITLLLFSFQNIFFIISKFVHNIAGKSQILQSVVILCCSFVFALPLFILLQTRSLTWITCLSFGVLICFLFFSLYVFWMFCRFAKTKFLKFFLELSFFSICVIFFCLFFEFFNLYPKYIFSCPLDIEKYLMGGLVSSFFLSWFISGVVSFFFRQQKLSFCLVMRAFLISVVLFVSLGFFFIVGFVLYVKSMDPLVIQFGWDITVTKIKPIIPSPVVVEILPQPWPDPELKFFLLFLMFGFNVWVFSFFN